LLVEDQGDRQIIRDTQPIGTEFQLPPMQIRRATFYSEYSAKVRIGFQHGDILERSSNPLCLASSDSRVIAKPFLSRRWWDDNSIRV
jgi:hypothetical protein